VEYRKRLSRPKDYFKDTCTNKFVMFMYFDFWRSYELITSGSSLIPQVLGNKFQNKLLEIIDSRFGIPLLLLPFTTVFFAV
jgi:hypothetical protein